MLSVKKIECEENVDLRKLCSIRIGGTAKKVFFPRNIEEIVSLYLDSINTDKKFVPIGLGSNTIFKDGVLDYTFVSFRKFKSIKVWFTGDYTYIRASAGVSFKEIVKIVKSMNLSGFENLAGIPATVGGAVVMNAGAFGSEISDILESVEWLDVNGEVVETNVRDIDFEYRYSPFQKKGIVLYAVMRFKRAGYSVSDKIKSIILLRNRKQPLDLPTSGSTYKNTELYPAGYLLEKSGLKGYRIGDIGFSDKHANFLVNYGNANFLSLTKLLEYAEKKVKQEFGIKLTREVKIVD